MGKKKSKENRSNKVKPNDSCPCKSGKKYKKCCSDDAPSSKKPAADLKIPTKAEIIESSSPDMVIYPESPVGMESVTETRNSMMRSTVGNNAVFELCQIICSKRTWKAWMKESDDGYFGEHSNRLLSVFDIDINGSRDEKRPPSTRDAVIESQLLELERRVTEAEQQSSDPKMFLLVPLAPYFMGANHALTEALIGAAGLPPVAMHGYKGAKVFIHKNGPAYGGKCPPVEDLIGPIPFGSGLRMQSAMTPILALLHVNLLLTVAKVYSSEEAFIFPHALVICSSKGSLKANQERLGEVMVRMIKLSQADEWLDEFQTAGHGCLTANGGKQIERVTSTDFMKRVRSEGCSLYPFFSDDAST